MWSKYRWKKKEAVFVIICDWFKFVFLRAGERDACDKLFIHCSYFGITKAVWDKFNCHLLSWQWCISTRINKLKKTLCRWQKMLTINFLLLSRRNKTIFIYQELERRSCAHYFDNLAFMSYRHSPSYQKIQSGRGRTSLYSQISYREGGSWCIQVNFDNNKKRITTLSPRWQRGFPWHLIWPKVVMSGMIGHSQGCH